MLISHLDGINEEAFYELVKMKLMDPPWNYNAYNSNTWEVGTNTLLVLVFDPCYARATVVRARFLAAAFSDAPISPMLT